MLSASSSGSEEMPCPVSRTTVSEAESQEGAQGAFEGVESSTVLGVHMPDGGWFSKCRYTPIGGSWLSLLPLHHG